VCPCARALVRRAPAGAVAEPPGVRSWLHDSHCFVRAHAQAHRLRGTVYGGPRNSPCTCWACVASLSSVACMPWWWRWCHARWWQQQLGLGALQGHSRQLTVLPGHAHTFIHTHTHSRRRRPTRMPLVSGHPASLSTSVTIQSNVLSTASHCIELASVHTQDTNEARHCTSRHLTPASSRVTELQLHTALSVTAQPASQQRRMVSGPGCVHHNKDLAAFGFKAHWLLRGRPQHARRSSSRPSLHTHHQSRPAHLPQLHTQAHLPPSTRLLCCCHLRTPQQPQTTPACARPGSHAVQETQLHMCTGATRITAAGASCFAAE
jgi:hypothetical protein